MSERRTPTVPANERIPVPAKDPNAVVAWLKELGRQAHLAWNLFLDPRVPWPTKLIPPAALLYLIMPVDILPDVILGWGQLDDLAVLLLGLKLFVEMSPPEIVREHLRALGAKITEFNPDEPPVVEGEFTVEEE